MPLSVSQKHIHTTHPSVYESTNYPEPKDNTSYEVRTSQASYRLCRSCFSRWHCISRPVSIRYLPSRLCRRCHSMLWSSLIHLRRDSCCDRTSNDSCLQRSIWKVLCGLRGCSTRAYALAFQSRNACARRLGGWLDEIMEDRVEKPRFIWMKGCKLYCRRSQAANSL